MQELFLVGGPRAILLLHAYTGTPNDVRQLGLALNKLGYSVYIPVFSGHGTTDVRDILNSSPQQWQQDAERFLDTLRQKGYQQIAVFGLSMGGMMALSLLSQQQSGLIGGGAFSTPLLVTDVTRLTNAFKQYAERLYTQALGQYEAYQQRIDVAMPQQMAALMQLSETIYAQLQRIELPVYVCQSGKDELVEVYTESQCLQSMPFAMLNYVYFEQATHVITVGAYRQAFQQSVIDFIENLEWKKNDIN